MIPLPFSLRTAASVSVFACIFIASPQGTQMIPASVATISALALEYAQLNNVYPLLIHQDTANNQADLFAAIATAVTIVGNLTSTLNGMTATGDARFVLQHFQQVAAHALAILQNVQADEVGGGE